MVKLMRVFLRPLLLAELEFQEDRQGACTDGEGTREDPIYSMTGEVG